MVQLLLRALGGVGARSSCFFRKFFSCADSSDLRSIGSRVEQTNTAGGKYASKHGIARHSIVGVKVGAFRIAKFPS